MRWGGSISTAQSPRQRLSWDCARVSGRRGEAARGRISGLGAMTTDAGGARARGRTGARVWTPTIEAYRVVEIDYYIHIIFSYSASRAKRAEPSRGDYVAR